MKKILILCALIVGCQSVSPVVSIGKDTYMVGANSRGGFTSDAEVTALSVRRAAEWCEAQGKQMELTNSTNSGTQGWTPQQSQVMFKCISK
ncbi:hypothetical protein [Undibacterium umbellatum]|uniref:Lipoprotein n=1 Tax=Undibacterium umbellatum TaxID=2762300 RepID=A0ABR6ZJP6_9BURK|nr:hypothetical protein [Undibacterium umbellatum]MBC3911611.1 hypothetical protein [Undibacterium umbellatum]